MAIFNEIIQFKQSTRNFTTINGQPLQASNSLGIQACVYKYLNDLSNNYGALSFHNISDCTFRLVFHGALDLYSGNWQANQDDLKHVFNTANKKVNDIYPIIHLTTFDIFEHTIPSLIPKRHKKIIDSSIWNYYVPLEVAERDCNGNIKKDASGKEIWKYSDNYDLFIHALEEISRNSRVGNGKVDIYNLSITHEITDLNARLLEQSYLAGSHMVVSPFLFHSETEMRMKIADYENEKGHNTSLPTIRQYRWRFLLLDDKSGERMSAANNPNQNLDICKLQIIAYNLRLLGFDENKIWFRVPDFQPVRNGKFLPGNNAPDGNDNWILDDNQKMIVSKEINNKQEKVEPKMKFFGRVKNGKFEQGKPKFLINPTETPEHPDDIQIVIDCVKHVDAAQYCLQKYKYEIVLLDYLLDKDKVKHEPEFGYQLLEQLNIWHQGKKRRAKAGQQDKNMDDIYQPGPNGRFFFMFISAFNTAVHERMLEKGYGKTERDLWFLGDGACPTNAPCLFAYQLFMLMRYRIKDLSLYNEGGYLTLIDLLKDIFVNADPRDKLTDVRERAHKHFNHVLFMRDKYKKLENDLLEEEEKKTMTGENVMNMQSSLLIQSAFQYVHHFSGSFFEHLQHLVYLTAFGTIRQWTELWEEYVFIHKTLLRYDDLTGGSDGLTINEAIRDYIIQLKENSN